MSQRQGRGFKRRGNFQRNFQGYDQSSSAGPSSVLKSRIGYQGNRDAGNQRGLPNRRQYLQRAGLPVRGTRGRGGNFQKQYRNKTVVPDTWSKVSIPHGKEYGREFLFKQLSSYVQDKFYPILFKMLENGDASFFIDNNDVAQAIETASRRIVAPNGQKVIVNVVKCEAPYIPLDPQEVEITKTVLQHRFNHVEESINLSAFIEDRAIKEGGIFLPLSRNNVMMAVISLLGDACPNLKCVDLSKNRIRYLDFFANLAFRCPNVHKLSLENNLIENVYELEKLSLWNLKELSLDGNPVCNKYRDQSAYISAVRRYFPNLIILDGTNLPPVFKTGIEEDLSNTKIPPLKASFFVNDNIKNICQGFIVSYFNCFDGEDNNKRMELLDAYDNDAMFTLSATNITEQGNMARSSNWSEFIRDSHNIKMMHVWMRFRNKLVQKGRLAIVSYFCKDYPKTKHDESSLIVDVSFATDGLICLNVSGLYKDISITSDSWRFFTRVFLLIPKNNGASVAIINEELFVSTLSMHEESSYRNQLDQINNVSTLAPIISQPPPPAAMIVADLNNQPTTSDLLSKQRAMIEEFSRISKMKPEWAEKCLSDCEWDFEKAGGVFTELNNTGQIPADAFITV